MTATTRTLDAGALIGETAPVSTPWTAPAFARPPHSWTGVRTILFPFVADPAAAAAVMPPGMELGDGLASIVLLTYPATEFMHPFNECVVLLPARVGDVSGNYVPHIYVTTDEALIPGREIAGWPKLIADIRWERDGERISASVTRFGERLLDLEGTVTGAMTEEMLAAGADSADQPSFNYKLIPGPDGSSIEVEEITSTRLEIAILGAELGTAKLQTHPSDANPVAALVAEAEAMMVVLHSDNTIPAGEVLLRIDRGARP